MVVISLDLYLKSQLLLRKGGAREAPWVSGPAQLEPKGGGGTDFGPAFAWATDTDIVPMCLIYPTDRC
jgi:hypothetical protein